MVLCLNCKFFDYVLFFCYKEFDWVWHDLLLGRATKPNWTEILWWPYPFICLVPVLLLVLLPQQSQYIILCDRLEQCTFVVCNFAILTASLDISWRALEILALHCKASTDISYFPWNAFWHAFDLSSISSRDSASSSYVMFGFLCNYHYLLRLTIRYVCVKFFLQNSLVVGILTTTHRVITKRGFKTQMGFTFYI